MTVAKPRHEDANISAGIIIEDKVHVLTLDCCIKLLPLSKSSRELFEAAVSRHSVVL
jgi:hypothetical protein